MTNDKAKHSALLVAIVIARCVGCVAVGISLAALLTLHWLELKQPERRFELRAWMDLVDLGGLAACALALGCGFAEGKLSIDDDSDVLGEK